MDDRILEPSKYYAESLEKEFKENASNYFDELVKKVNLNVEENRVTAENFRKEKETGDDFSRQAGKKKGLKAFLIVMTVFCFVAAAVLTLMGFGGVLPWYIGVIIAVVLIGTGIGLIVIIAKKINPAIKSLMNEREAHEKKAKELYATALKQMSALNSSYDSDSTRKLIIKTVPVLEIDKRFEMKRFDFLNGKYGFCDNLNKDESTLEVMSGQINGNPFVIERVLKMRMGTETYHGSLTIYWTETYRDSKGNLRTRSRSETLHATVTKPKPFYFDKTNLIYGNEAAPDLTFSHEPTHAERLSEKELEKKVKSGHKALQRQAKEAVEQGGNFTEMANEEFDVLFNGEDRNNEVQFRLLFTPLAQKNMLTLMKNPPYGDDFYFRKRKKLNIITSEHSQVWDMNVSAEKFFSYDVDIAKENFINFNVNYFKSLFFDFAPLLSIPLYQQQKPAEYIYKKEYVRNYPNHEAELMANALGQDKFRAEESQTETILKARLINVNGNADRLTVNAYSFTTESHTDYVSVFGGDGRFHSVPVHWLEYIPIESAGEMEIQKVDLPDKEFKNNEKVKDFVGKNALTFAYKHGILGYVINEGFKGNVNLNEIINEKGE